MNNWAHKGDKYSLDLEMKKEMINKKIFKNKPIKILNGPVYGTENGRVIQFLLLPSETNPVKSVINLIR